MQMMSHNSSSLKDPSAGDHGFLLEVTTLQVIPCIGGSLLPHSKKYSHTCCVLVPTHLIDCHPIRIFAAVSYVELAGSLPMIFDVHSQPCRILVLGWALLLTPHDPGQ